MKKSITILSMLAGTMLAGVAIGSPAYAQEISEAQISQASTDASTYSKDEVLNAAVDFFGTSSGALAQVVEKVFKDQGEPVGYIIGQEGGAAFAVGLKYGHGELVMKDGTKRKVYWRGPSVGFDTGVNGSKVFTLVYNLGNPDGIYRRYPGVEGSAFFIAGVAATYQQAEGVTLAPIRTGVGFRLGANVGYTAYSSRSHINPF
jgi:hypothetical protein